MARLDGDAFLVVGLALAVGHGSTRGTWHILSEGSIHATLHTNV